MPLLAEGGCGGRGARRRTLRVGRARRLAEPGGPALPRLALRHLLACHHLRWRGARARRVGEAEACTRCRSRAGAQVGAQGLGPEGRRRTSVCSSVRESRITVASAITREKARSVARAPIAMRPVPGAGAWTVGRRVPRHGSFSCVWGWRLGRRAEREGAARVEVAHDRAVRVDADVVADLGEVGLGEEQVRALRVQADVAPDPCAEGAVPGCGGTAGAPSPMVCDLAASCGGHGERPSLRRRGPARGNTRGGGLALSFRDGRRRQRTM